MAFTYFFRDMQTLAAITDVVLPAVRTRRRIRIWDAGCAMGPEPYSIAILLRKNMGAMTFRNVSIDATDIDESGHFGETIAAGEYPPESVKRIPSDLFSDFFEPVNGGKAFRVRADVRGAVRYTRHDLLSLRPVRHGFGLIVCKNVLLHFREQDRAEVVKMFHDSLEPGGFLVTEQTQKMPPEAKGLFEKASANTQVWQKAATA